MGKKVGMLKISLAVLLGVAFSTSSGLPEQLSADNAIFYAARAEKIDYKLLRAICKVETGLRPHLLSVQDGHTKSYGLCQVKYATAKGLGYKGSAAELATPYTNALVAAKYLTYLQKKYGKRGLPAVLSAYNAGRPIKSNSPYVNKVLLVMSDAEQQIAGL